MRRLTILALMFLAALSFACAPGADDAGDTNTETADAAESGDEGDREHGGEVDERAAWSKPQEVYEFLEIGAGARVVDLMAGGGYNTVRLASTVGRDGMVIVEGGNDELRGRVLGGDLQSMGNIEFVDDVYALADGSADFVLAVRAYHLFPDVPAVLAELHRALVPGGVVGIVEVRLNQDEGHDMTSHRMGEQTVISDMAAAGFEYVGASDLLRRDDDDYGVFVVEGRTRYMSDRMLLKFRKAE